MKLNEKTKELLLIVTYAIVLIFALFNLKEMFRIIIYILKLIMPFIIGIGIAFVLNILLKIIETKVYPKIFKKKTKQSEKFKRPICLVSVMVLVIALISLIFKLVIPELINAVEIFSESLPKYTEIIEEYLEEKEFSEENIKMVTDTLNEVQKKATSFVMTNTDEIAERILYNRLPKAVFNSKRPVSLVVNKQSLSIKVLHITELVKVVLPNLSTLYTRI